MSQLVVARFLGAGLAAAAITTVILTDWQQCGSIGGSGMGVDTHADSCRDYIHPAASRFRRVLP